MRENELSSFAVNAALKVHTALGPGLLESAYEACLVHELRKSRLSVVTQHHLPVLYDGIKIDAGYRLDAVIEDLVILELKAIDALAPIHSAQLLSYLKLSGKKLGLLMNFHVVHMKDGIKRIVNGL